MLKDFAKNWLPLLFNAFIATDSQERNSYGSAIAAYSTIADAATLSHFFREVIKRLLKVRNCHYYQSPGHGPIHMQVLFACLLFINARCVLDDTSESFSVKDDYQAGSKSPAKVCSFVLVGMKAAGLYSCID